VDLLAVETLRDPPLLQEATVFSTTDSLVQIKRQGFAINPSTPFSLSVIFWRKALTPNKLHSGVKIAQW
jgi:hypothetical protein